MTAEDLRERKRALLEQKRDAELAGDRWEAAFVNEELLDVNAQLRALTGHRVKRRKDTGSQSEADRKQFLDWEQAEAGEEADGRRAELLDAAKGSLEELTGRQREVLELHTAGLNTVQIAARLGVDKSNVSRTLSRAKKNAAQAAASAAEGRRLLGDGKTVDLFDGQALRAVVLSMTPKQLLYFYLYYSEGLTLREVEELTGTDHTAVCRTVQRARLKLDKLFGGRQDVVLDHPEAIDEAAYWAWRELEDHPELVPEPVRVRCRKYTARMEKRVYKPVPHPMICIRQAERSGQPGKLLAALLEQKGTGLLRWLGRVFVALQKILTEAPRRQAGGQQGSPRPLRGHPCNKRGL